jgi:hypothetical protein
MGMGSGGGKGIGQGTSNYGNLLPFLLGGMGQSNTKPSSNSLTNPFGNFQQSKVEPQVYNQSYSTYPQPTGEAFNNGVNSDSGIAAILAGLYSSGVFNQQTTNPYAPQGTTGSFTGIPYGQQQQSMFSRQGLNNNPYGGAQGQSWNPYGNYYTSSNTFGGNTNNNVAPPPRTTGPDALQQLSFMMQNNQNTQI